MDPVKYILFFCLAILSIFGISSESSENYRGSGERLNNLVKRMAVVEKSYKENGPAEFVNPRHGFVWFKTQKDGTFTVNAQKSDSSRTFTTWECEGYIRLPAGKYTCSGDWGGCLRIHSVPTLIFSYFLGKASAEEPWHYSDNGKIGVFEYNFRLPDLGEKAYVVFSCLSRSE